MFCIKCGRNAGIENLCEKCFLERENLFSIDNFSLFVCDCGSYYDNHWNDPETIDKVILDQIKKRVKTKNRVTKISINLKKYGNKVLARVVCSGYIRPAKAIKKEERQITITLNRKKCENCVKFLGGYYEAVLQLRGDRIEKILSGIEKFMPKARPTEVKGGCDIRFVKKGDAKRVAKQLKRRFDVKESFKFVTTKKGKRLYRNYYSIK